MREPSQIESMKVYEPGCQKKLYQTSIYEKTVCHTNFFKNPRKKKQLYKVVRHAFFNSMNLYKKLFFVHWIGITSFFTVFLDKKFVEK